MKNILNRNKTIFLLHFQRAFVQRTRSVVWLVVTSIVPIIYLFFWQSSIQNNFLKTSDHFSLSDIQTYYLTSIVLLAFLVSHPEEFVAEQDIHQAKLANYLLKPTSYFTYKVFLELPWRLIQGVFGMILVSIFYAIGYQLTFVTNLQKLLLAIVISILAFILIFTYKMILGITAFWTSTNTGIMNASEVTLQIFGGILMPLTLLPISIYQITSFLPFAYMIYFPITALQGKLTMQELLQTILIQLFWIGTLSFIYKIMWKRGLLRFTAAGQ